MKKGVVLSLLLVLAVLPAVSAEIFITQPATTYNVGDELSVTVTVQHGGPVNEFLEVDLLCSSGSTQLYRSPLNVATGEQRTIPISAVLDATVIDASRGTCTLEAQHGEEVATSQEFELTSEVEVDAEISARRANPGATITITGTASKLNGELVQGFIEARIPALEVSVTETVTGGAFSMSIVIPANAQPGNHEIEVHVFEKDSNGVINNEGNAYDAIIVNQLFKSLEIELPQQNVVPGEALAFTVLAHDQTGSAVEKEVSLTIYQPGDVVFLKKLIVSSEEQLLEITPEDTPGYWKLEVAAEGLSKKKLFYVEEKASAHFSVLEDTLIVTNTGNVPYSKAVEISIGSGVEIQQMNIPLGVTEKFQLNAPDGEYEIRINDGVTNEALGTVALTGNAISVGEVREGFVGLALSPAGWFLGGLILLLIIVLIYSKVMKKKLKGIKKPMIVKNPTMIAQKSNDQHAHVGENVVGSGVTEQAGVIALHVRSALTPETTSALNGALMTAKSAGANVYVDGNYRIIIVSPMLTKQLDSPFLAVTIAKEMERALQNSNNKSREKLEYGIGVNVGPIISEMKNGKFTFTSRGSIIPLAKKLAQSNEVLLSDALRKRVMSVVKTEQASDTEAWRVTSITDRSQYKAFTDKFKQN